MCTYYTPVITFHHENLENNSQYNLKMAGICVNAIVWLLCASADIIKILLLCVCALWE